MKKELDALSKEELVEIAKQYNLYDYDNMTKEHLIKSILQVNQIKYKIKTKDKYVVSKRTSGTSISVVMLGLTIVLLLIMTIAQYFTRFYFAGKLFQKSDNVFGLILSLLSLGLSLYIFWFWWKFKVINIFMIFNLTISIGYFIYFLINYYDNIKYLNNLFNDPNKTASAEQLSWFHTYKTLFFVWIGISATLATTVVILLIIKNIPTK